MKNPIFAAVLFATLSFPLACMHKAPGTADTGIGPNSHSVGHDRNGNISNPDHNAKTSSDATVVDPEGDLAPPSICKRGEVEMRQSGKIVCAPARQKSHDGTMSGR
jgi:hypothetical protein